MPPQVTIYLQYKTCISNPQYANQEFDIMLLLTKISTKDFTFYKTYPCYIQPINFLKQYGISLGDEVFSISDIISQTKSYMQQLKNKQQAEINRQYNALIARNRPKRRWHL